MEYRNNHVCSDGVKIPKPLLTLVGRLLRCPFELCDLLSVLSVVLRLVNGPYEYLAWSLRHRVDLPSGHTSVPAHGSLRAGVFGFFELSFDPRKGQEDSNIPSQYSSWTGTSAASRSHTLLSLKI